LKYDLHLLLEKLMKQGLQGVLLNHSFMIMLSNERSDQWKKQLLLNLRPYLLSVLCFQSHAK